MAQRRIRRTCTFLTTLLIIVSFGLPALAQTANGGPAQMLLTKIHMANQVHIRAGEIAMRKGTTDRVRAMGERLMRDHGVADGKVLDLASDLGIDLPRVDLAKLRKAPASELSADQKQKVAMLRKLQEAEGARFDKTYAMAVKKGHTKMINTLTNAVKKVQEEEVVDLVEDITPILRQHKALAEAVLADPADRS